MNTEYAKYFATNKTVQGLVYMNRVIYINSTIQTDSIKWIVPSTIRERESI